MKGIKPFRLFPSSRIIQYEESNVLIDTGTESLYKQLQQYLKSKKVKQIDKLVITHPDAYHMGAEDLVIQDYAKASINMTTYKSKLPYIHSSDPLEYVLYTKSPMKCSSNLGTVNSTRPAFLNSLSTSI